MSYRKIEGVLAIIAVILVTYISTLSLEVAVVVSVALFVVLAAWDLAKKD